MSNYLGAMFVLLVSASCLLQCKLANCNQVEQNNAVEVLSDYLTGKAKTTAVPENLGLLKSYMDSEEFARVEDADVRQLAQMLVNLQWGGETFCEPDNLANMRQVVRKVDELLVPSTKSANSKEKLLLNRVLRLYKETAVNECLASLQNKWGPSTETRFNEQYGDYLREFDEFNKEVASKRSYKGKADLRLFDGAVNYPRGPIVDNFVGALMFTVLTKINQNITQRPSLAGHPKTGNPVAPSVELAAAYLDEYLIEPCKEFLADKTTKSIVLPIANIGLSYDIASLKRQGDYVSHAIEWAARSLNCQWLLGMDKNKLATAIATQS